MVEEAEAREAEDVVSKSKETLATGKKRIRMKKARPRILVKSVIQMQKMTKQIRVKFVKCKMAQTKGSTSVGVEEEINADVVEETTRTRVTTQMIRRMNMA